MEHDQKVLELLESMEKANRRQLRYARLQFIFTVVAALCCAVLLIFGLRVLPQLQDAISQAETVLGNLETVTTELANSDLISMVGDMNSLVENVDSLVTTSQSGVEQTMEKINAIDFESLNQAIEDLSDVIEPIAKFFNNLKFG